MNILAIDTSGPVAGCAVMTDGRIVHSISLNHGLTHSETVMPAVEEALSASGLRCADMDVFAAVAGPGSFTGVRLGVCAAKGMAHAVNRPCVPIHALEALSMNFFGFDGLVCPILDARRRQVYCGDGLSVHAQTLVEAMGERAMLAPANLRDLRADAVCALAERRREEWIPAQELRPVYLRAPQAERERNARLNREGKA